MAPDDRQRWTRRKIAMPQPRRLWLLLLLLLPRLSCFSSVSFLSHKLAVFQQCSRFCNSSLYIIENTECVLCMWMLSTTRYISHQSRHSFVRVQPKGESIDWLHKTIWPFVSDWIFLSFPLVFPCCLKRIITSYIIYYSNKNQTYIWRRIRSTQVSFCVRSLARIVTTEQPRWIEIFPMRALSVAR